MKIIGFWCLIAQMKRQNTLNSTQKTSTLSDVPLLNKLGKPKKMVIFGKMVNFGSFS